MTSAGKPVTLTSDSLAQSMASCYHARLKASALNKIFGPKMPEYPALIPDSQMLILGCWTMFMCWYVFQSGNAVERSATKSINWEFGEKGPNLHDGS